MDKIKFRGRAIPKMVGSQWQYGYGVVETEFSEEFAKTVGRKSDWYLEGIGSPIRIYEKTIGQYTMINDFNGVEVYDGDIINWDVCNGVGEETYTAIVRYSENDENYKGMYKWIVIYLKGSDGGFDELADVNNSIVVIGNIHDNPEMLEV